MMLGMNRPTYPPEPRELSIYRHDKRVVLRELAARLGVSISYLSHVETGQAGRQRGNLQQIGVSYKQLGRILDAIDAIAAEKAKP